MNGRRSKITGTGETPAPSDKVINLSEVREGAGGSDGTAVTAKNGPPAPEVTDPPLARPKGHIPGGR